MTLPLWWNFLFIGTIYLIQRPTQAFVSLSQSQRISINPLFPSSFGKNNNNEPPSKHHTYTTTQRITSLSMSKKGGQRSKLTSAAEFEFQELRAQLNAMKKQNLSSADLPPAKRTEIESYVRAVATLRDSPVPMTDLYRGDTLVGNWRLAFSTESASLSVLPKEARVYVRIYDNGGSGRLDYTLKFIERVFALKSLTAQSRFSVDPGPINPGLVTFQYEKITSDIFGITIPTGLFGLLKGRTNYIESVYFDGKIWIERGFDVEGQEFFQVYFREEE